MTSHEHCIERFHVTASKFEAMLYFTILLSEILKAALNWRSVFKI